MAFECNLQTSLQHQTFQGSPNESFPGLENFFTAVAYHCFLNLPATFSHLGPCTGQNPSTLLISIWSLSDHFWGHATNWLKPTLPSLRNLTSATWRLSEKATNLAASAIGPTWVIITILSVPYNVHIFHPFLNMAMWVKVRDQGWDKGWGDFITAMGCGVVILLQQY